MQRNAATDFWREYLALPQEMRARADKRFSLLKANPQHPSLQFKKVGERHQPPPIVMLDVTGNF